MDERLDGLSAGRDADAAVRRLRREGVPSERLSCLEPDREDGGFSMLEDKGRDSELLEAPFSSRPNFEGGGFGGSDLGFAGIVLLLWPSRLRCIVTGAPLVLSWLRPLLLVDDDTATDLTDAS